jgi:outer membrane protein assembly factor BamB
LTVRKLFPRPVPLQSALLLFLVSVSFAQGWLKDRSAPGPESVAQARRILEDTGVKGGLVVHVGCGDGSLTTALRMSGRYVVHGLGTDPASVAGAREAVRKAGLYGPVAVDTFDGEHLPYAENLVNLVVAGDLGRVSKEEVMRVLCPRGVAYVKADGAWTKAVKRIPGNIDEWPHYLHGADNNAVARDTVVGPPRRMQWVAGPLYARSHEINSSMAAMVSAGGRLFYIWDDGPTGMTDKRFPARWKLIARDAFNGIPLWERSMPEWGWRQWHAPSRWEDSRDRARMLRHLPSSLPRRLVAVGDRLYVTLGYSAPVSVLDAASGEVVQELKETALTDEILHTEGMLILRVRLPDSPPEKDVWSSMPQPARARVMVVDAQTGRKRWQGEPAEMAPLSLAARKGCVFFSNYQEIVCLDLKSGRQLWRSQPIEGRPGHRGTVGTLVAHDKVVLFASYPAKGKKDSGRLHAFSAQTGKLLWQGPKYVGPGVTNPPDLFVANGLVWVGETKLPVTHTQIELKRQGFDPVTGKVAREVVVPKLISWGHHYRCYRSKATERFLMLPKRGVEFVDLVGKEHMRHDWLRAPCIYGMLPTNGLLYVAPHQCVCYQGVLLSNFNALAPQGAERGPLPAPATRLQRGPSWGQVETDAGASKDDWPAYRRDPRRSGSTGMTVPDGVKERWHAQLLGPLTPPVVARGRLLVAEKDTHTVRALDAGTGKPLWQFTAGGRVDSPPTVHGSLVLFGSADGRVYCLRLSDGQEVWRFLAAPRDLRVTAFGQVESVWPVHGSVLVQRDAMLDPLRAVAYVTAGRSSYLDGGIRVYGLDPGNGEVLHEKRLDGPRPDPFTDQGTAGYMDGAKSGLLVSDGSDLYLFQERLRGDLKRVPAPMESMGKEGGGYRTYPAFPQRGSSGKRLITTHGFLADIDNEGKYWTYGDRWPGWDRKMNRVPAYGQLLVFDDNALYGVHVFTENIRVRRGRTLGRRGQRLFGRSHSAKKDLWSVYVPIRVRAMVLAGKKLYLAGPPDVVPADDSLAAIEGRRGAALWTVSAADGSKVGELALDVPPVWDGLAAAGGCLYLSTVDGKVVCLGSGN